MVSVWKSIINAKKHCVYDMPPAGCARMHSGIMPFHGVHPAQETNQNASALFVSYNITGEDDIQSPIPSLYTHPV